MEKFNLFITCRSLSFLWLGFRSCAIGMMTVMAVMVVKMVPYFQGEEER